jgi:uncharacterized surface protein with fasciclin (FAS1) repeats
MKENKMRYVLTMVMSIFVLAIASTSQANCGACGSEKNHDKGSMSETKADMASILETAQAAGKFNTLLTAVKAAGLTDALSGEGPFTVFAPTDEAFAALPEGTVEALLKDKEKLSSILTYHVVSGEVKADKVVELEKAETLNGKSVSIKIVEKKVMIDNAQVTATDIICTNGVIHVIDSVILPQA